MEGSKEKHIAPSTLPTAPRRSRLACPTGVQRGHCGQTPCMNSLRPHSGARTQARHKFTLNQKDSSAESSFLQNRDVTQKNSVFKEKGKGTVSSTKANTINDGYPPRFLPACVGNTVAKAA